MAPMVDNPLTWITLHEVVGHGVIFLLLASPLIVIVSLGTTVEKRQMLLGSALVVMLVGMLGAFAAFKTGELGATPTPTIPELEAALVQHRAFAATTLDVSYVLCLGFTALFFVPRFLRRPLESRVPMALLAVS